MPIGIQRINDPHPQPSSQIIFIKPLPNGPNLSYAEDFLQRIAAICHPIMKTHHLSIMTLEEHEPNREFVGRNFNAGEIIQLVLRSRTGDWLSFRTVQMVMVHELAHCIEMNHARAFWKVRNLYAEELRGLWAKGYTGDGMWGRGRTLLSGEYDRGRPAEDDILPEQLCGGAYRRSRWRRKRKRTVKQEEGTRETYAERKERRIKKKFGVNGQTLGGDEEVRVALEYGVKIKAQPRVANSSRGRELRVAAALARFGQQKAEDGTKQVEGKETLEDEASSTTDDEEESTEMVRICDGEDADDVFVQQEMEEIRRVDHVPSSPAAEARQDDHEETKSRHSTPAQPDTLTSTDNHSSQAVSEHSEMSCPICSLSNEPGSTLCIACSHVLDPSRVDSCWKCTSAACLSNVSAYVNAGDVRRCGACGNLRAEV